MGPPIFGIFGVESSGDLVRDLFVLVNPNARQGRLPNLLDDTAQAFSGPSYNPQIFPTAADVSSRETLYRTLAGEILSNPRPATLVCISGDGTASAALAEVVRQFEGSIDPQTSPAEMNAQLWERFQGITMGRAGSADDFSNQIGAPENPSMDPTGLPQHLDRAVRVPWTPMRVSGEGLAPTPIFEAVGGPTSARMFRRGLQYREAAPQSIFSRGITPFTRAITMDFLENRGFPGVDVEIKM